MAAGNFDGVNIRDIALGGMIHEEVLNRIIDSTPTDTPFLSAIGQSSVGNDLYEWPLERLRAPVIDTQVEDGSEGRADQSAVGIRVRNFSEIRTKTIRTSTRANQLNTIGFARALVRQLNRRGLEHRRDLNATMISNNGAVASAAGVAPRTAAYFAWASGNELVPAAPGATVTYNAVNTVLDMNTGARPAGEDSTGWRGNTAGVVGARPIGATASALSETAIRVVANEVWKLGNNPTKLHARPDVITKLSQYMFTSSARIASQIQDSGTERRTAVGEANRFLTDFGVTLEFVPDRQMLQTTDGTNTQDCMAIYDPSVMEVAQLMGLRAKPLSSDGLTDNRELQQDLGFKALDWLGMGGILNIDANANVVA